MKAALVIFLCGLAAACVAASDSQLEDHLMNLLDVQDVDANVIMDKLDIQSGNPVDIGRINLRLQAIEMQLKRLKQHRAGLLGRVRQLKRMWDAETLKCQNERKTREQERALVAVLIRKLDQYDARKNEENLIEMDSSDMLVANLHDLASNLFRRSLDIDLSFKEKLLLAIKGQAHIKPQSKEIRDHLNELMRILADEECHQMKKAEHDYHHVKKEDDKCGEQIETLGHENNLLLKAKDCGGVLKLCSDKHDQCQKSLPGIQKQIKDKQAELETYEKKCAILPHLYKVGDKGNPGTCCKQIKEKRGGKVMSGNYWIKYENKLYEVFCDMETDGGGWTAVINPTRCHGDGLPLSLSARRINGGTINTCGAKFYRDKNYGFHRLRGYSCGNWGVGWSIVFKNTMRAREMMYSATLQGDNYRSMKVDGRSLNPTRFYAGRGNCAFYNGNGKMLHPGTNQCWNTAFNDARPLKVRINGGSTISIYMTSGYACKPDCKFGCGFNIQQWWIR